MCYEKQQQQIRWTVDSRNLGSFALGQGTGAEKPLHIFHPTTTARLDQTRNSETASWGHWGTSSMVRRCFFGTDFAWGSDRPHLLPVYVIYIPSLYLASHGDIPPKGYGWGRRLFVITFIDTPRCVGRGLVLSTTVSNSGGPLQTGQTRPAMWGTSIRRAIMHTKPFDTFTYLELEPVI
jgi:hypothetical protein